MVLFRPTFSGVGRLELHSVLDEAAAASRKRSFGGSRVPEKTMVRLQDCLSAAPAPGEHCPDGCTAFYLNTLTCTYVLASTASQQWLSAIWLVAFQVPPFPTRPHLSSSVFFFFFFLPCINTLIIWERYIQKFSMIAQ